MKANMTTVESKIIARIKSSGRGWCFTPKHFTDLGTSESKSIKRGY